MMMIIMIMIMIIIIIKYLFFNIYALIKQKYVKNVH